MHDWTINFAFTAGVSGQLASVVSGAEKTVKDLEQLSTADVEALIDSIEALLQADSSQDASVAGLADPVLSKNTTSPTQGECGSSSLCCANSRCTSANEPVAVSAAMCVPHTGGW